MLKDKYQHRLCPQILSRNCPGKTSTSISIRLEYFLLNIPAITFFLYVNLYSPSHHPPPVQISAGSEASVTYNKLERSEPSKQLLLPTLLVNSREDEASETLDEHTPRLLGKLREKTLSKLNCSMRPKFGRSLTTFRNRSKLIYRVNLARNAAREMASTHYVLSSDIELYPSGNLIADFLEMIQAEGAKKSEQQQQGSPDPRVFVLPIFEVEANVSALPNDKMELVDMLDRGIAIPFHNNTCRKCHTIPKESEWMRAKVTDGLHVFHVGKRQGAFKLLEPIFIGTKLDPIYDERLSWDGQMDKMTQAYILCVLDYEFHILDNAFLVHRPGIKKKTDVNLNKTIVKEQEVKIQTIILPELVRQHGTRPGCKM